MATGSSFEASPGPGQGQGLTGKRRNIFLVWIVWPFITLGIYHLYWWYKINDEARKFDPRIEVDPVISLLAIFPGSIIIVPPFVTVYRMGDRLRRIQAAAGQTPSAIPVLGLILVFVFGLYALYYQMLLNQVWESYGDPPADTLVPLKDAA